MAATNRAGLYLCPPPAARLAGSHIRARESRVRTHLRPLLRAASRAMLRLADFTMRLGLMYAGLATAAAATILS